MKEKEERPVIVNYTSKEYEGIFHGWSDIIYKEVNDDNIHHFYKVGVIENLKTGEITELGPENFRFLDRQ